MTSQTIPTIERNPIMTITNNPEDEPNRSRRIVDLCHESFLLWDPETETYPTGTGRAEAIAAEIEQICSMLAAEARQRLTGNYPNTMTSPPRERQQFKNGQWRSSTWIDLRYETDPDGRSIDYEFLPKSDRGAHLFRIWFTARGIGFGLRPDAGKTHKTRSALVASLPTGYPDLEPVGGHKHESHHDLCLRGRRSQKNQYFAQWHHCEFASDAAFFRQVDDVWSELGPVLNLYRC